jgi:hypothetical protein
MDDWITAQLAAQPLWGLESFTLKNRHFNYKLAECDEAKGKMRRNEQIPSQIARGKRFFVPTKK